MFVHFGMNTFTDKELGDGNESPEIFNPVNIDVNQWVSIAKEIGFKYIILTVKHHDGFCLWPSLLTDHTIKNSPYKFGNGDIVKEFAEACHSNNIKFSIYLSPYDRHDKRYGSDDYNIYFKNQLVELLTNYGDTGEVWFDGANAAGVNGTSQNFNWDLYYETVRSCRPNALMAICGPDIRWVGNENGLGSVTEWSVQPKFSKYQNDFGTGLAWFPSECDVSIRPGWFYHAAEDNRIKSVEELTDIYFKSVGRNSNLLLNIPPNKDGLISQYDVQRLRDWKQHIDKIFANNLFKGQKIECSNYRDKSDSYSPDNCLDDNRNTFWVTDKNVLSSDVTITFGKNENINILRLEEAIEYGQRIKAFEVYCNQMGTMVKVFGGTTVGRSRIIKFNTVNTDKIKIVIKDAYASPTLREIKAFYAEGITPD